MASLENIPIDSGAEAPRAPDPSDEGDRLSGMAGRDFIKSFPTKTGKTEEGAGTGGLLMAKTSTTVSKWAMGLKSWSKKASADLASGKTVMRMRQQTKEYLGSTQKTVDNELISKIEAVKTMEHDLKVLVQLTMEVAIAMKKTAECQLGLAACFEHLTHSTQAAAPQLGYHQRVQDVMGKNSVGVIEALNFFRQQAEGFVKDDLAKAWAVVQVYEDYRIEYDACRVDYESLKDTQSPKLPQAEARFLDAYNCMSGARSTAYDSLVTAESSKAALFKKQLEGLSNAMVMYINGNQSGMEEASQRMLEVLQATSADNLDESIIVEDGVVPGSDTGPETSAQDDNAAPF